MEWTIQVDGKPYNTTKDTALTDAKAFCFLGHTNVSIFHDGVCVLVLTDSAESEEMRQTEIKKRAATHGMTLSQMHYALAFGRE